MSVAKTEVSILPHKHSPRSKRVIAKRERFKMIQEYRSLKKLWDPERHELICLENGRYFVKGEVLKSPKHVSPQLK